MDFLKHSEINENSFIMIEFEDGISEPYFVDQKRTGGITGATMLLGHKLSELIQKPKLYPCSRTGSTDLFYIANEEAQGQHKGVLGYRKLNEEEKNEWKQKIKNIKGLSPLDQVFEN